ncbi:MAG: metalloregulator ArsR/SmtB family transcription factor [Candidatus Micrarchaeia archaeon]
MKNRYVCDVECIDRSAVGKVKARMLPDKVLFKAAGSFRVLGDSTRIKILHALSHRELCVCDLAHLLSMSQSAVSHQLRVLRNSNLVRFSKEGKVAHYSLSDRHILELVNSGVKHAKE